MKKILAVLLLIPSLAFADALVYVSKTPVAVTTKLQGPQAYVEVAGVKVDQPIAITATGTPVWAVIVTDAQLATINKDAAYLGKGLDAVKTKSLAIYNTLTVKTVKLADNTVTTISQAVATPVGATVLQADIPIQTFSGWDAKTGDLAAVKPVDEKIIVK